MPAPASARWRTVSPLDAVTAGVTVHPSPPACCKGQVLSETGAVKPSVRCACKDAVSVGAPYRAR